MMTQIKVFHSAPFRSRKYSKWFLASSWCVGLLFGVSAARCARTIIVPMMRSAVSASVSIPGLFAAAVLPFLLSAYAVSISEPWLLLIISTLKAFGFSFCAFAVSLAFGQSSWLVRFLFLFSDYCLIPILYLYWLRHISEKGSGFRFETCICITAALVIGSIDYCIVSPFLASLI